VIVVRRGLPADQDDLLPALGPLLGGVGSEYHTANRRPRGSVQAAGRRLLSVLLFVLDHRLEQLLKPIGIEA
jgi:hypothetical protein